LGPTERPFWQHPNDSPLTRLLHALWALQAFLAANPSRLLNYAARYRLRRARLDGRGRIHVN
jgi:hypothetical protein